jgi:hypothetical protein
MKVSRPNNSLKMGETTVLWTPKKIESLRLWLRADIGIFVDDTGTIAAVSDGDMVGLWKDQSGNGYDVSQGTDDKKPLLKLTTNGINNKPVLLFDGSNDILIRTVANWLSSDSSGCAFIVINLTSPLQDYQYLLCTADQADVVCYVFFSPYVDSSHIHTEIGQRNNDTATFVDGNKTILAGSTYVIKFGSNGIAYNQRCNGEDLIVSARAGNDNGDWFADSANRDNLTVGGMKRTSEQYFVKGKIAEILVYGVNLSGANLARVENYLRSRYGVFF